MLIRVNGDPIPGVTDVRISSTPSHDADDDDTPETYVRDAKIRVQVTFDKAVTVDTTGGRPRLKIDFSSEDSGEKWVPYETGSGTKVLTFAYDVVEMDRSTEGVAVLANTLELNSGTIQDAADATIDANLAHTGLDHNTAHKVEGTIVPDETAPAFSSATVNGKMLAVTFGEALDLTSAPAGSAFTVSGGRTGTGTTQLSGAIATVTLDSAVAHGQSVTVGYNNPGTGNSPLRDGAGNEVQSFSGQQVTNNTPRPPGGGTPPPSCPAGQHDHDGRGCHDEDEDHSPPPPPPPPPPPHPPSCPAGQHDHDGRGCHDEDEDHLQVSVGDVEVLEGTDEEAVFEITLSGASDEDTTIRYETRNGTAAAGEDYESASGELTIAAGSTSGTVGVPVLDDDLYERGEHFELHLEGVTEDIFILDGQAFARIKNDDPKPRASIRPQFIKVREGRKHATFTVELSAPSGTALRWEWRAQMYGARRPARAGQDYRSAVGHGEFGPGETVSATQQVEIIDDDREEEKESFQIKLLSPNGHTGWVDIYDNDGTPGGCPAEATGSHPDCECPSGEAYDSESGFCVEAPDAEIAPILPRVDRKWRYVVGDEQ